MKKLEIFTLEQYSQDLARELVKLRCVDVDTVALSEGKTFRYDISEQKRRYEKDRDGAASALQAVMPYYTGRAPVFKKKKKIDITRYSDKKSAETAAAAEEINAAAAKKLALMSDLNAIESETAAVRPWEELTIPLGGVSTSSTVSLIGSLPKSVTDGMIEEKLGELCAAFSPVGETQSSRQLLFFIIDDSADDITRRLAPLGFSRADFTGLNITASEYLKLLDGKKAALEKEIAGCEKLLSSHASGREDLELLWDVCQTRVNEAELTERLACTGECVQLTGWVPERMAEEVAGMLSGVVCAYEFSDPLPDDNVPVLLENNRFARNFEWIIGMYSLPKYGTYDPTFIMSICYSVLFSMMFSDVGYGILMILGGFLLPAVMGLGEKTSRAFRMFGICGIFCVVSGILFGGYFGDLPLAIMRFADPDADLPDTLALIVDPVLEPMTFMIIGLAVGFCHLVTGQAIKFALVWKESPFDAICDYAFYWVIYTGIIIKILLPGNAGLIVAGAGAAAVVLTAGRKEKKLLMKPLKGFLGLYGLVNFGSDIISYARILAIALSGTVLAQVFNILATYSRSPGFVLIGTPVILIIGHILNLALSALSAFVHTSRLQYVEFFGKFYIDGGRPYQPSIPSGKYSISE